MDINVKESTENNPCDNFDEEIKEPTNEQITNSKIIQMVGTAF